MHTKVMVVALNFAPELTGIGKYVGEMTQDLAARGFAIRVVTAPPYYPAWRIAPGTSAWRYSREHTAGADVIRCPLYVSARPGLAKRLLHLASFAASSAPVVLWQALRWRPDVIFMVAPPLMCAPTVWLAGRLSGAHTWLHVQDFEVDAAFGLGLMQAGLLRRVATAVECRLMQCFDRVSSISARMVERLLAKGVTPSRTWLFPNWVDTSQITQLPRNNALRRELAIADAVQVLLYSGNMGEKQGLDLVIDAARTFNTPGTLFLLCGDGAVRERLERAAADLPHVRFLPLQPQERLAELLALADIHLLPQRAGAEDLVLPSKLTAMMASARPVIATASAASEVGRAVAEGGLVVPPGDHRALCLAIQRLLGDPTQCEQLGRAGRAYAQEHWQRDAVLSRAAHELRRAAS